MYGILCTRPLQPLPIWRVSKNRRQLWGVRHIYSSPWELHTLMVRGPRLGRWTNARVVDARLVCKGSEPRRDLALPSMLTCVGESGLDPSCNLRPLKVTNLLGILLRNVEGG